MHGYAEPHVHWHIFPRYEDDPNLTSNPWLHAHRFGDEAREVARRIGENFA